MYRLIESDQYMGRLRDSAALRNVILSPAIRWFVKLAVTAPKDTGGPIGILTVLRKSGRPDGVITDSLRAIVVVACANGTLPYHEIDCSLSVCITMRSCKQASIDAIVFSTCVYIQLANFFIDCLY